MTDLFSALERITLKVYILKANTTLLLYMQ